MLYEGKNILNTEQNIWWRYCSVLGGSVHLVKSLEALEWKIWQIHNRNMVKGQIQKKDRFRSVFKNRHMSQGDKGTSLALHQDGEQSKQKGYITLTGNTLLTKTTEQHLNSVYELQILNDTKILCYKCSKLKSQNITQRNCNINTVQERINHPQ